MSKAVLKEARKYVAAYGQQNAETGTRLQANIAELLAKIDEIMQGS